VDPKTNLAQYVTDLTAAHDALATRMYKSAHAIAAPAPSLGAYWAVDLKRKPVSVRGAHQLVGVTTQPLGELINQLATVERLIGALGWAGNNGMTDVEECHPTTSRGAKGTCSHDLVVSNNVDKMVFEVSDVAGDGNANKKIVRDLATLLGGQTSRGNVKPGCSCTGPSTRPARKFLAVSLSSGKWLVDTRPGATVHVGGSASTTWIVEP